MPGVDVVNVHMDFGPAGFHWDSLVLAVFDVAP